MGSRAHAPALPRVLRETVSADQFRLRGLLFVAFSDQLRLRSLLLVALSDQLRLRGLLLVALGNQLGFGSLLLITFRDEFGLRGSLFVTFGNDELRVGLLGLVAFRIGSGHRHGERAGERERQNQSAIHVNLPFVRWMLA